MRFVLIPIGGVNCRLINFCIDGAEGADGALAGEVCFRRSQ